MLTSLRIKNLALVDDLTIDLLPGYNVITGETGAGKSILIGALTLVLGERADRTLIRDGCDGCSVEASFDLAKSQSPVPELLDQHGLEACQEGQLLLKRSFTAAGTNRQYVNGSPTTLSVLAELGQWLVDIHGPHDHQSLLHPSRQLAILDSFGKIEEERERFATLLRRRGSLEAEKSSLIVDERTYLQQLELLRHQTSEISGASLQPNEDELLEQQYKRASNSARLLQLSQAALDLLAEQDTSLLNQAAALGRTLQELQRLDSTTAALTEIQSRAVDSLHELQAAISHYVDRVEVDPARLQELEERLNLVQNLKRKYGPALSNVMAFGQEAARKLADLEQRDEALARLNARIEEVEREAWSVGSALSAKRRKLAPQLGKAVCHQLADLGFKPSRFEILLTTSTEQQFREQWQQPALSGLDTAEFQFAPNPGEPPRPLRAIASSGELARVMLALKTVLANEDRVPVLIFDEIDANVGGETAVTVGEKMRQIAQKRQVLCITHLPQVAAAASTHFLVSKDLRSGRTFSRITLLEPKQRVVELARMLGGQTEASRKHAAALLKP
ncbi:MAG TPA: DNA repair protein RecN [Verrucomicrobiae bacterium]|nr:DNA repair protein RecN [Verrucomicrobiae bacterium]